MLTRRFVLVLLTIMFASYSHASGYFEYSHHARETYQLIFNLRFQQARSELVKLRVTEPENLIAHSLANYLECLSIFIGEEIEAYEKLKENKDLRLTAIRQGDPDSPYFLYTQADIYLQWAITRVKFEDYFQAVLEIKRAFSLLTKNEELFPDFMPNKKNLGLLHALIGTVPDQYRWGVRLLGMEGTIAQGRAEIEEVLHFAKTKDFIFRDEAYVMYAYLLLHLENNKEEAWKMIQGSAIDPTTNPLACFVHANVAMQSGRNEIAIEILANKPEGPQYFPFPYLTFMEGVARLNKLEKGADEYLRHYINKTRGIHYIKEAYQKLGWYEIIQGRPQNYLRYMQACKSHGAAVIDEDISALSEARSGIIPDKTLLMARLLFDGGYYQQARVILEGKGSENFTEQAKALEYLYRLGRIHHQLKDDDKALRYYQQTINKGRDEGFFYACNAALMSGIIYENRLAKEEAAEYYRMALSMRPDQYRSSLHQKAKAGLNRIENWE